MTRRVETGTNSQAVELDYEVDLAPCPVGWMRIVLDIDPTLTNGEIMDIFFTECARLLNGRGLDGTEREVQ